MHASLSLLVFGALLRLAHAATTSLDGIYSLVQRQIPEHADSFTFSLFQADGDSFAISDSTEGSGINVQCSTVSACARGLYTYLTQYGGVDIWWTGSRLSQLPSPLPAVGIPVNGQLLCHTGIYHFNTVTFDYTATWWDWDQWQAQLDWLALRGVNLPLAWVGYEYILIQVFQEVGLSDDDIASFLSGPAFQAWNRFGNIQGSWGGPLPTEWIDGQYALQQQIVARMYELGMTPALPAFTGFVPRALAQLYPNASIVNGSQWDGFPTDLTNVSFLEPWNDLFVTMQKSFIAKQQAAYGANISHIYTLDQYNENSPYSGNTAYLANISSETFAALRAADPEAVWMMQGWLFFDDETFWTTDRISAYLGGVPGNDSMIILDLFSEVYPQWQRTESYYGKQWVWCELHDFGGNMGFEGNLPELVSGPIQALAASPSMKGMGLTMEGQEGNEIVYDIVLDQAWSANPLAITAYVESWVARRYLVSPLPAAAQNAWSILSTTVYSNAVSAATIKSILEVEPAISGLTDGILTAVPYDTNTTIVPALQNLIAAAGENPALLAVPEFLYDIVDVTRQLLANRFIDAYNALVSTYNASGATSTSVTAAGEPLLTIISDVDAVLWTNDNFLLSNWIASARSWAGSNSTYADYLEYNARNQITLWGPDGEITDYASKQWAGLVGTYYYQRWETFVGYLANITASGTSYDNTTLHEEMLSIGEAWDSETWSAGWEVTGDTMDVVTGLVQKWIG
ncbi:glycoside hydrolase family 89 protein [Fomitopsis serialis]|uniref:glycoside hydrolase family 89 protein n=1 Tax=Fomitopsis serialis TaxID=139415 RepID=UPI00200727D9|nr:glycoside hydrolase family 89 protein [Neoantrodia serialis]KAH9914712.1 glycoside hydrolase family 89 protein [Neoantrodia serialis]